MATATPPPTKGRKQPALSGQLMVYTRRGRLVIAKWPRKRGRPRNAVTLAQNEWFKQANVLAKFASGQDQWMAQEITRDLPLYPRDVLISAMAGRLFERLTVDGEEWYSMAVIQDISADLDLIGGKGLGNLMMRGASLWVPLEPGQAAQVLTSNGPTMEPSWQPGGGAGSGYWTSTQPTSGLSNTWAASKGIIVTPASDIQVVAIGSTGALVAGHQYQATVFDLGVGVTVQAQEAISAVHTVPTPTDGFVSLEFLAPAVLTPDKRWYISLQRTDGPTTYIAPWHTSVANSWIGGIPSLRINVPPYWQVPGMLDSVLPVPTDIIVTAGAQRLHMFLKIVV